MLCSHSFIAICSYYTGLKDILTKAKAVVDKTTQDMSWLKKMRKANKYDGQIKEIIRDLDSLGTDANFLILVSITKIFVPANVALQ